MALTKTINPSAKWTAPASTFRKQLGSAGTNAGIKMNVAVVRDDVTPALHYINSVWEPAVQKAMIQAGAIMKKAVAQTYMTKRGTYSNHPMTYLYKGFKPALEETGALRDSMTGAYGVDYNPSKPHQVRVYWDLPESGETGLFPDSRKDNTFEYLWAQEFGSGRMKTRIGRIFKEGSTPDLSSYEGWTIKHVKWNLEKRPFFVEGMKKGAKEALGIIVSNLAPIIGKFRDWKAPRYASSGINPEPDIFKAPAGLQAMGWYFVPPSAMYKYIGIAADMHGVWAGSFSDRSVWGYVRQYAYGQGGITRKSVRRKFRRKVWY